MKCALGILASSVLLASCAGGAADTDGLNGQHSASTEAASEDDATDALHTGTWWELRSGTVAGDGISPIDGHPIRLRTTSEEVWAGSDGCNDYEVAVTLEGHNGVEVVSYHVNTEGCSLDDVHTVADLFADALFGVEEWSIIDGAALHLRGPETALWFERR